MISAGVFFDVLDRRGRGAEVDLHHPGEQIDKRGACAAIRHVHEVDAGHHLEQLAGHVGRRPTAGRCHVDLARICLGIGDELWNRFGRNRRMYRHDVWVANDASDGRDVADEIEIELVVERRVDRVGRSDQEERVSVGGRAHYGLGADVAAAARPVLDDEWLAEPLREPLTDQARDDVTWATRSKGDDDPHRPRRIGLRPSEARDRRQSGSARRKMQKSSARQGHGV